MKKDQSISKLDSISNNSVSDVSIKDFNAPSLKYTNFWEIRDSKISISKTTFKTSRQDDIKANEEKDNKISLTYDNRDQNKYRYVRNKCKPTNNNLLPWIENCQRVSLKDFKMKARKFISQEPLKRKQLKLSNKVN